MSSKEEVNSIKAGNNDLDTTECISSSAAVSNLYLSNILGCFVEINFFFINSWGVANSASVC